VDGWLAAHPISDTPFASPRKPSQRHLRTSVGYPERWVK
jgi:hypothetical protein